MRYRYANASPIPVCPSCGYDPDKERPQHDDKPDDRESGLAELVAAARVAAQQLEDLGPSHLNWHLLTGEIAKALYAALAKVEGK